MKTALKLFLLGLFDAVVATSGNRIVRTGDFRITRTGDRRVTRG